MAELLKLENVWAGYGDAVVLEDISFSLEAGGSLALLGRNGMGKTTLLSTLMGATRFKSGRMSFDGRDLAVVAGHQRARVGLGWVPQERDIFPSLSVEENLTVVSRPGPWNLERAYDMFPRLKERRGNMGNQLSGGEQQMLALARALMLNPKLLLLDEPLEGLAPLIVEELLRALTRIVRDEGLSAILVEQNPARILAITDHALVLERGRVAHAAPSAELLADPATLDRYLAVGGGHVH